MVRVARVVLSCILLLSVAGLLPAAATLFAADPFQPVFTGFGTIDGPVSLELNVTPAVAQPGDQVLLQLLLTNQLPQPVAPQVILRLPGTLSLAQNRFPAGVTVNLTSNEVSWLPLVDGSGKEQLTLSLNASVADIGQPEQQVTARLQHGGQSKSVGVPVWVGLPPTAVLSARPAVAAVGQPVQLRVEPGGSGPFAQSWDFGDGRHITTPNPQIVYAAPGVYQVSVQLANPLGAAQAVTSVTVVPQPKAGFTVDDELPVPMQSVQFINQSGGEAPLHFTWDFGDGTTSTERNPAHQFPATGYYEVRLLVQSALGESETARTLVVGNGPGADFLIDGGGVTGAPITAQAVADETVTRLHWEMGDGTTYEGRDVRHVYHAVGTYLVTLTAANNFGETRITKPIAVTSGTFTSFIPAVTQSGTAVAGPPIAGAPDADAPGSAPAPSTAPAAPGPAIVVIPPLLLPTRTPPLAGEFAPNPGGAGPTDGLPDTVMPQASAPAPDASTSPPPGMPVIEVTIPEAALPPSELITLPAQAPLLPNASPAETLLWYINEARRLHNLPALNYDYQLSIAAQVHSEDMAAVPGVMHIGSDGTRPADRQVRFGFGGYYAGEAVAWGWENPVPVVEFWVNSPPHRVLILNPNTTHVGVGYYADGRAENIWYWTAEFGLKLAEIINPW